VKRRQSCEYKRPGHPSVGVTIVNGEKRDRTEKLKIGSRGSGASTSISMGTSLKWLLCILIAIPLAAILLVPFVGTTWHLLHGDFIFYLHWKIRVPPTFYVRHGADGPFLWKLSFGFPLLHGPYAVIGVSELNHPFKYEEDYPRFMTGADMAAQDQGYKFLSSRDVSVGKTLGHCLEYGQLNDPARSFVQCTVEHTSLLFSYRGHTKYIPILFSILQSISDQNAEVVQSN
jgi:hypothetical protein